jgi:tetrahydrodipicolinate N-succinyltransferase
MTASRIHGRDAAPLSTGTAVSIGAGVAVSTGVSLGDAIAVAVGVGVGVGAVGTEKANSPEIGCPSLETTFHSTVTTPDAAPLSGCVTTVPSARGSPSASDVPAASVTWSSVAPGSVASSPLKVRVS